MACEFLRPVSQLTTIAAVEMGVFNIPAHVHAMIDAVVVVPGGVLAAAAQQPVAHEITIRASGDGCPLLG